MKAMGAESEFLLPACRTRTYPPSRSLENPTTGNGRAIQVESAHRFRPRASFPDASCRSRAPVSFCHLSEEFLQDFLSPHHAFRLSPGMERAFLAKRDHLVCDSTQFLGLWECGFDPLVFQQLRHHRPARRHGRQLRTRRPTLVEARRRPVGAPEHGEAMCGGSPQLSHRHAMAHHRVEALAIAKATRRRNTRDGRDPWYRTRRARPHPLDRKELPGFVPNRSRFERRV
eukprot:scaffold840_cov344-Pavlova_lutheri.AAC.20